MELLNATPMLAGYTMGLKPDGRELLVVAIKGTFTIPSRGAPPQLADKQMPLIEADTFTGEPGLSAPVYETDYAPHKARCDVVLTGTAYAPKSEPVKQLEVGLQVGSFYKCFQVVGDRVWEVSFLSVRASAPMPFHFMPISYDRAFGGVDNLHLHENKHSAYMLNPVGRGYHQILDREFIEYTPLPNTEEIGQRVSKPRGQYRPMAFGPLGRGWEPRYRLAGTYDQTWLDNTFPFLPADFNEAYYQCAPVDQQIDYLRGGEEVKLINLTPSGYTTFRLPTLAVPVVFFLKKGGNQEVQAVADTLVLEPDAKRFMITWRAHLPLKKNMFEVAQVLVGKKSRGWWRARQLGKTYYPSLAALTRAKRKPPEDEDE
jgi:hypothetical protein